MSRCWWRKQLWLCHFPGKVCIRFLFFLIVWSCTWAVNDKWKQFRKWQQTINQQLFVLITFFDNCTLRMSGHSYLKCKNSTIVNWGSLSLCLHVHEPSHFHQPVQHNTPIFLGDMQGARKREWKRNCRHWTESRANWQTHRMQIYNVQCIKDQIWAPPPWSPFAQLNRRHWTEWSSLLKI